MQPYHSDLTLVKLAQRKPRRSGETAATRPRTHTARCVRTSSNTDLDDELDKLHDRRADYYRAYHRAVRLICKYSLDHPSALTWLEAAEVYEARVAELDALIDRRGAA